MLCVWTVLHLNVPPDGSTAGHVCRQLQHMTFGLLAPDVLATYAWRQLSEARKLCGIMQTKFGRSQIVSNRQHRWTLTHSFYTLMGGFTFEIRPSSSFLFPGNRRRITLTAERLILVARNFPDIRHPLRLHAWNVTVLVPQTCQRHTTNFDSGRRCRSPRVDFGFS
ncbi:hypothetical protein BU23DRAFT_221100 [Bimuria novae-zelandiae CBS 107.79]|uniref:Uncharacterized protein n=1 Tax=Bimuria novae-zelandiae CBS 107.79 TaxID=1447943 RepID=A0A6A5UY44_9PLEO|nr:hypothetical protein BU23DRAFT_221100 [Bimuria novae-zelandiae CBS 107.79]